MALSVQLVPVAALYADAKDLLRVHGYDLPVGFGWGLREELADAVNTVYLYTPVEQSVPALEVEHDADHAGSIVTCTRGTGCSIVAEKLQTVDSAESLYRDALSAVLSFYGVDEPVGLTLERNMFVAVDPTLGQSIRACHADGDCSDSARPTCCDLRESVPGLCCSRDVLNRHDAEISPVLIIIALSIAGVLSLFWTFNCCRRLHDA